MTLINAHQITLSRGSKPLFRDLSLTINPQDRIALVGHNGCGKSSLLRLLAGEQSPDDGELTWQRGLRIGTMEQFLPEALRGCTARDAVLQQLPAEERAGSAYRADALLGQLGIPERQFVATVDALSGGQQNLVLFARARVLEPELLLMDEPGNHMDESALAALRGYLQQTRDLTFLMVSHDRDLLDACCSRTVFLRDQRSYSFDLPYTPARAALETQDEQAAALRGAQEKEIRRIRASARRLAQWGRTFDNEDLARKAKTMDRRADKLDASKTEVTEGNPLTLSLDAQGLRSRTVVTVEDLTVHARDDNRVLLRCEHLVIAPGDRVALLGANGTGKSTTIARLLAGHGADEATVRFNPNVTLGYFDQELAGFEEPTARDAWLRARYQGADQDVTQTLLGAGVAYADQQQPVNSLSGGERARMVFMLLALVRPNLMVLDEPTNHIDLESREQLETQLIDSGATLVITSHDRRFLSRVCNRYLAIIDQRLVELHDLERYYAGLVPGSTPTGGKPRGVSASVTTVADAGCADDADGEEALLARIETLETLLRDDLARKPKFQKPQRQARWREELSTLWAKLDDAP
ncbi:MAG: ABC-F family ATP-binding cassette domain-containing protein [Pseudomonadota bacterium]